MSANMMRRLLVDRAWSDKAAKRGDDAVHVNLDDAPEIVADPDGHRIAAIDDALKALAPADPRKEKVVERRLFGGLSAEETAEVLKISPQSVLSNWKLARAWLMEELAQ